MREKIEKVQKNYRNNFCILSTTTTKILNAFVSGNTFSFFAFCILYVRLIPYPRNLVHVCKIFFFTCSCLHLFRFVQPIYYKALIDNKFGLPSTHKHTHLHLNEISRERGKNNWAKNSFLTLTHFHSHSHSPKHHYGKQVCVYSVQPTFIGSIIVLWTNKYSSCTYIQYTTIRIAGTRKFVCKELHVAHWQKYAQNLRDLNALFLSHFCIKFTPSKFIVYSNRFRIACGDGSKDSDRLGWQCSRN